MRYYLVLAVTVFCLHSISTSTPIVANHYNNSLTSTLISTDEDANSSYELVVNINGISIIEVDILNIGGGRSTTIVNSTTVDSDQTISIDPIALGLASGNYMIKVKVNDEISIHEFNVE